MINKRVFLILLVLMSCKSETVDLENIKFGTKMEDFFKNTPVDVYTDGNKSYYDFGKGNNLISYENFVFDDGIEVATIDGLIQGYQCSTNNTEISYGVLKRLEEKYGKGEVLFDAGDERKTYRWVNGDLLIGFMMAIIFTGDEKKKEISGALTVTTKQALEEGLFPYDMWILKAGKNWPY